jgi:DNA-binding NtrC family response regulator
MRKTKSKILVVDDDPDIVLMLTDRLEGLGYETVHAGDGTQALQLMEEETPRLVLLDLEMPRLGGLEVLAQLEKKKFHKHVGPVISGEQPIESSHPTVIVMTAHATIPRAVEAMKSGAYDFLTKPLDVDHLAIVIQKALERDSLKREVEYLRREVSSRYSTIVGKSQKMKDLIVMAKRAANSDATVLLLGESGTGKELFARSVHQWSDRRNKPFVVINCVALTGTLLENELFGHERGAYTSADTLNKGKIEIADGGTVFLDEIGDMPSELQAKLLRLLQDHEFHRVGGTRFIRVNIRVIAATNRDLKKAVREGNFREDLFFRLNVVGLNMPSLRDRPEDIPDLAEMFLKRHLKETGKSKMVLSSEALNRLRYYSWPGNIRELDNTLSRAVVLGTGKTIEPDQLGLGKDDLGHQPLLDGLPYHEAMEEFSHYLIEKALERADGNQRRAAEELKLQRTYLARLVRRMREDPKLAQG